MAASSFDGVLLLCFLDHEVDIEVTLDCNSGHIEIDTTRP